MYSSYETTTEMMPLLNLLGALFQIIAFMTLIPTIVVLISQWKIYKKAGKKGWECLIPIYNIIILLQIVELPMWYIALFFVPFANIYAMFKIYIELAHKFGKSTGFGVLTVFFSFICLPILAFSKNCTYNGNVNETTNNNQVYNQNDFQNPSSNNNNLNQNNILTQEPITFNQNINTEINPINNIQQPLGFVPTMPINNPQPELNVEQEMTPSETEQQSVVLMPHPVETNLMNNQVNLNPQPVTFNQVQEQTQPTQELNVIPNMGPTQSPEVTQMNNQVSTTTETTGVLSANNPQPELNVAPGLSPSVTEQPSVVSMPQPVETNLVNNQINTNQQPVTFNQVQEVTQPVQGLNVIPNMGPTPNPTTTNQNPTNNQNM